MAKINVPKELKRLEQPHNRLKNLVTRKITMLNIKSYLKVISLSLLTLFSAQAEVLQMVPFQGRLHGSNNEPVENGRYDITFSLYDAAVGGQVKWSEVHSGVSVIQGYTNVLLGTVSKFEDLSDDLFENPLYVGISINGGMELFPRQQLIPSFHAVNASKLGGKDASDYAMAEDVSIVTTNMNLINTNLNTLIDSTFVESGNDEQGNVIRKSNLAVRSDVSVYAESVGDGVNYINFDEIQKTPISIDGFLPLGTFYATTKHFPYPSLNNLPAPATQYSSATSGMIRVGLSTNEYSTYSDAEWDSFLSHEPTALYLSVNIYARPGGNETTSKIVVTVNSYDGEIGKTQTKQWFELRDGAYWDEYRVVDQIIVERNKTTGTYDFTIEVYGVGLEHDSKYAFYLEGIYK